MVFIPLSYLHSLSPDSYFVMGVMLRVSSSRRLKGGEKKGTLDQETGKGWLGWGHDEPFSWKEPPSETLAIDFIGHPESFTWLHWLGENLQQAYLD